LGFSIAKNRALSLISKNFATQPNGMGGSIRLELVAALSRNTQAIPFSPKNQGFKIIPFYKD